MLVLKWMKRLALVAATILFLALLTGFVYEQWSRQNVAQTFPPPGELVEVDGKLSHLHCSGEGSPTVVLEAGINEGGSQVWEMARPAIAPLSRVCAYDQAGIMWSEHRDRPRDADHIAEDLHALLAAAGESPPYVMVGHSLGGLLIRVFADHFSDEVVGFVFVDSSHPEQNKRFPADVLDVMAFPSPLLLRAISAFGVLRLESSASPSVLPQEVGKAIRSHLPQSMTGIADVIETIDNIFTQAQYTGPFGDLPIVVLTAGHFPEQLPYQMDAAQTARLQDVWSDTWPRLQAELTALSTNTDWRVIEKASHNIPLDAPEAITAAVRDVIVAQREDTPVRYAER
ncbi:alpha/beta hydrolase [Oscillatoria sp. CS-180]|uniref:alpha/beta fold hydrolase n=1 Tax=Oscillatoria sp. CS-180 TaxID=3021720 RepID=UPI00232E238A|nr:alpha/beta hydrolase [Oscillatoria sp. CS-180]MDB9529122.1 alpha/beta hydrolase [Oscillatoria sp. CS-180]